MVQNWLKDPGKEWCWIEWIPVWNVLGKWIIFFLNKKGLNHDDSDKQNNRIGLEKKKQKIFITSCMIPFWTFLISFSVFSFSFLFNNIDTFVMYVCVCVVWKFLLRWIIILLLCTKTENEIQFRKKNSL